MSIYLPEILVSSACKQMTNFDAIEFGYVNEATRLFESGFYSYSILALWNAAMHNLKRRVEAFGVELWEFVVKTENGRKKYDKDGSTIAERWENVDDLMLIQGAKNLGLLNPKASKALEMINWMRNHVSAAHESDVKVDVEDSIAIALLLQKNLFEASIPEPGHSVFSLFDPIKNVALAQEQILIHIDQIKSLKSPDLRKLFGFLLELLCNGTEPSLSNSKVLFPVVWELSIEDLRKTAGLKYHSFAVDETADNSIDKGAKTRLLEMLVSLNAIKYIPDGSRANIYRKAASKLANAKDASYGWASENSAARVLSQLGPSVPSVVFEEVYQEILSTFFGNYWGRSESHNILADFISSLNTDKLRLLLTMIRDNERVRSELFNAYPKNKAVEFLESIRTRFTLQGHIEDLDTTIENVKAI